MKKWAILIFAALILPAAAVGAEPGSFFVAGTVRAVECSGLGDCEVELEIAAKSLRPATRIACVGPRIAAACRWLMPGDGALIAGKEASSRRQATHVALLLHGLPKVTPEEALTGAARFVDLEVEFDQIVEFAGLRIHFKTVVEDSRCPQDVVCIWSGRCIVTLALWHGMTYLGDFDLVEGEDPSRLEIAVEGYVVRLMSMLPIP